MKLEINKVTVYTTKPPHSVLDRIEVEAAIPSAMEPNEQLSLSFNAPASKGTEYAMQHFRGVEVKEFYLA